MKKEVKTAYTRPEITTVATTKVIESLGPAVAVYGNPTGGGGIIP